ncbi:hypothetical protein HY969_03335 [Candidatus Kaiserbacteria bacterium]|nr:hypothetical protein [Candidatus Kaiserbacteria bacterium]
MNPGLVTVNGLRIVPVSTHIKPAIIISPEKRRTDSTAIANALRQALEQRPDIVILPEYARYVRREGQIPEALAADIRKSLKETKTLVVDSEPGYQNLNGGHPSIILIDGESGEVLKRQHKRYLIPLGEFLPYFVERALRLFGLGPTIDVVRENRTYAPSLESYASRVVEWHGIKFAALLCSESFSPFGYRSVSDGGADVLINLASHAFFRERSSIIFGETLAMALVHSAFTGKVYVQATNYGPSLAIYPRGKVPAP